MYIIGADENGLGFTKQGMLGPLVITATGFRVNGSEFPLKPPFRLGNKILVCDSKDLFKSRDRRSVSMKSYRLGETTSLSFLSLLENIVPENFDEEILRKILIHELPCDFKQKHCFFNYPLSLPVWADVIPEELITSLQTELQKQGIEFIYCKCSLLCPGLLHQKDKYKEESRVIGQIITDWLRVINNNEYIALLGRIKNYSEGVIKGWWKDFGFSFDTENITFITKGDKTEFPISLSSVIGKYIREIFIERINKYFRQFNSEMPLASGYRQNKSFDDFVKKAVPICKKKNIPLSCLIRDYPL